MKKFFSKIPAPFVIFPLLSGIIIYSIINAFLSKDQMSDYGDVMSWVVRGFLMLLLFGLCTQIKFRSCGKSLTRGSTLLVFKFAFAATLGIIIVKTMGTNGLLGISALAIVATTSNPNIGLFAGISKTHGEEEDSGSVAPLCLTQGPAFTLIVFMASGLANVDFFNLIMPIIPMVLGIVVGNIFPKIRPATSKVTGRLVLPLFMLSVGATISISRALQGGGQGILLGAIVLSTGIMAYFLSRIYMGKGKRSPMAAGVGSAGANAISIPFFVAGIAGMNPEIVAVAAVATAQIAMAVILTAFLTPFLVAFLFKYEQRRRTKLGIEC